MHPSRGDSTDDDATVDDPLVIQQHVTKEAVKRLVTLETLNLSFALGMRFQDGRSETTTLANSFIPNCPMTFPKPNDTDEEFEKLRILFITRVDQNYEDKYTLVVVYIFNLGILLTRIKALLALKAPRGKIWEENFVRQQTAIQKWSSRLKILLQTNFLYFINTLLRLGPDTLFDFDNEFRKILDFFEWNESVKNKWFINLCLTLH
ncbi:hypothetical protein EIN_492380 [Entamoeba invadens IP1]|uniref:Uncharacterized protein n=1 Tax=Entamoeba invadens IP1 TaxID=370355 RepID=A0A0A1UA21_ENTIV|nr:hypothetical protein EIN_492380 [Entamoeba invadens IP1]ELP88989.1 hypothetical protein EIN_492380 [Entamoeba invadens IP1]|eukprot:XP_004255760.1 hypothetical protein EIN_492380 [Entamoeba invadens IP1]